MGRWGYCTVLGHGWKWRCRSTNQRYYGNKFCSFAKGIAPPELLYMLVEWQSVLSAMSCSRGHSANQENTPVEQIPTEIVPCKIVLKLFVFFLWFEPPRNLITVYTGSSNQNHHPPKKFRRSSIRDPAARVHEFPKRLLRLPHPFLFPDIARESILLWGCHGPGAC